MPGSRLRSLAASGALAALAAGCGVPETTSRSVEIAGGLTLQDQAVLAQRVLGSTSIDEVRSHVTRALPEAAPELLAGLSVRVQLPHGSPESVPGFNGRILCELRHDPGERLAEPVLELCRQMMQAALDDVAARDAA